MYEQLLLSISSEYILSFSAELLIKYEIWCDSRRELKMNKLDTSDHTSQWKPVKMSLVIKNLLG